MSTSILTDKIREVKMADIWEDNTTNEWGLPVRDLGRP